VTGGTNFGKLTLAADNAGVMRSFLATEENFAVIKDAQRRNLIVPVTGDVSGPRALRAVGSYLKAHDTPVTAFYISNVEQYLFGLTPAGEVNDGWRKFYANVATLPITSSSVFHSHGARSTITVTSGPDGRPQMNRAPIVRVCPIATLSPRSPPVASRRTAKPSLREEVNGQYVGRTELWSAWHAPYFQQGEATRELIT